MKQIVKQFFSSWTNGYAAVEMMGDYLEKHPNATVYQFQYHKERGIETIVAVLNIEDGKPDDAAEWLWIRDQDGEQWDGHWKCSKCGETTFIRSRYCPECGRFMENGVSSVCD